MKAFDRNELKEAIRGSIKRIYEAQTSELDLYRNTLDCFSASIDAVVQGISLDEWLIQEKERQVQKTKQNAIGSLHEEIMGSIPGVNHLAVGNVVDIVFEGKQLVAEIKNKHNTTKGNHKIAIYDDLLEIIVNNPGYTGYYVEILPRGQNAYDEPFTPSDNRTKQRRPVNERIRRIDGKTFYALLTGYEEAIEELYCNLPELVADIIYEEFGVNLHTDDVIDSRLFEFNYRQAYGR